MSDEGKNRRFFKAFGIVAPDASQWTSFKKYASADAVTVVYAEFLNVEYDSVHFMLTNFPNQLCQSYFIVLPSIFHSEGVRFSKISIGSIEWML